MIVNVSRLLAFLNCEQQYSYRYEHNLVGEQTYQEAMDFGTAIHEGLREWYKTKNKQAMRDSYMRKFEEIRETDEDRKLRGYGIVMLEKYVEQYREDEKWQVKGEEVELRAKLGDHTLVGRLDLIVEADLGGRQLLHVNHKTVGNTVGLETYVKKYDLAWHERAYVLLGRENGIPLVGSVINILRKTKVPSFMRSYIPVPDELIERFKQDALIVIGRMEQKARIQNTESCVDRYRKICPYQPLCLGSVSREIAQELYKQREPDYVDLARKETS